MPRTNVMLAALAAALVLPATASAGATSPDRDETPKRLQDRGEASSRADRSVRERPVRAEDESPLRNAGEHASRRHAPEARTPAPGIGEGRLVTGGAAAARRHQPLDAFSRGFDRDEDGRLSSEERTRMEAELPAYHERLRAAVRGGRDGRLDDRDWERFLTDLHGEHAERHVAREQRTVAALSARFDADGTGTLDAEEADRFRRALDARRLARLRQMDRDGDGRLGVEELQFAAARARGPLVEMSGLRRHVVTKKRTLGFGATSTDATTERRVDAQRD